MKPDLTIIMCVYDEMGRIQKAVEDINEVLKCHSDSVEILVIDNGSTDGSREWLENLDQDGYQVVLNEHNIGKGGSIKKGIALSNGKYVVIHDPDMEYRAADIWPLLDMARGNEAALVLGSRVLEGEVRYKYYQNWLGVQFLNWVTNTLYGCRVTDTATAMKLIDGNMARSVVWRSQGFDLDFELVARIAHMGGKILEGPADYYPRTKAEGKKIRAVRDGIKALRAILLSRFW